MSGRVRDRVLPPGDVAHVARAIDDVATWWRLLTRACRRNIASAARGLSTSRDGPSQTTPQAYSVMIINSEL